MSRFLILDLATAPLDNAADFITMDDISAPSNYKDPDAIRRYVEGEKAKRLEKAALDPDTCRITAVGLYDPEETPIVRLCSDELDEAVALERLSDTIARFSPTLLTYGGLNFDLPVLLRRARYLNIRFPAINTDRYKTSVVDLCESLSDRNPSRRRPLGFYIKRLGWTDLAKPLSGAEEAQIFAHQRWADLELSSRHDLTATYRLAQWAGVLAKADTRPEPIL